MDKQIKLKKIKREIIEHVPINYYIVSFDQIWGNRCIDGQHDDCLEHGCLDNEPSYIAEIEPVVTKITKENYNSLDWSDALKNIKSGEYIGGDTHDLRTKIFGTKKEAIDHVKYTVNRFRNPSPWECFVKY